MEDEIKTTEGVDYKFPEQKGEFQNIDKYEREKVESTLADLKLTIGIMENYLKMMDFADSHNIKILNRTNMDKIRQQNGPAGVDNDMIKLQGLFAKGQTEIAHSIPRENVEEFKKLGFVK